MREELEPEVGVRRVRRGLVEVDLRRDEVQLDVARLVASGVLLQLCGGDERIDLRGPRAEFGGGNQASSTVPSEAMVVRPWAQAEREFVMPPWYRVDELGWIRA